MHHYFYFTKKYFYLHFMINYLFILQLNKLGSYL